MSDKILPRVWKLRPLTDKLCPLGALVLGDSEFTYRQEVMALEDHQAILKARDEKLREMVITLFPAIAHGDQQHRDWLKEAIEKHFDSLLASSNDERGGTNG